MKYSSRIALVTAFVIFLALSVTGCGSKTEIEPASAFVITSETTWKDSTSKYEKKIQGFKYPNFQSNEKPKIASILNDKVEKLLDEYFEPIQQDPSSLGKYPEFDLKGEFINEIGNFITIKISGYTFVGDANHGQPINEILVFDYQTEDQVYLSYFIPKLSNQTISSMVYRQLKFSLGFDSGLYEYIPENLSIVSSELQWWPDTDGIRLFFPSYSVAPYSEGPQEAFISWLDIRDEYPDSKSSNYNVITSLIADAIFLALICGIDFANKSICIGSAPKAAPASLMAWRARYRSTIATVAHRD